MRKDNLGNYSIKAIAHILKKRENTDILHPNHKYIVFRKLEMKKNDVISPEH